VGNTWLRRHGEGPGDLRNAKQVSEANWPISKMPKRSERLKAGLRDRFKTPPKNSKIKKKQFQYFRQSSKLRFLIQNKENQMPDKTTQIAMLTLCVLSVSCLMGDDFDARLNRVASEIKELRINNEQGAPAFQNVTSRPQYDGWRLYTTGEFLYWKVQEDSMQYSAKSEGLTNPNRANVFPIEKSSSSEFSSSYEPGFRIGLGFHHPHDQWDFFAKWTRLQVDDHPGDQFSEGDPFLFGLFAKVLQTPWSVNLGANVPVLSMTNPKWHFDYDTADFEVAREFFVSKALSLRPHIGARGLWIDQKNSTDYSVFIFAPTDANVTNKQKISAGGLKGGFDLGFHVGNYFHIFGKIAGSLVYGRVNASSVGTLLRTPTDLIRLDGPRKKNHFFPNIETGGGIEVGGNLFKDRIYLSGNVGYEFIQWFGTNYMVDLIGLAGALDTLSFRHGDLGIHGLTAGLRLDF